MAIKPNRDVFQEYVAQHSGIILGGRITTQTLYNSYKAYCRKVSETPLPYDALETKLNNVIHSIRIWWTGSMPLLVISPESFNVDTVQPKEKSNVKVRKRRSRTSHRL